MVLAMHALQYLGLIKRCLQYTAGPSGDSCFKIILLLPFPKFPPHKELETQHTTRCLANSFPAYTLS
eukprot:13913674-Ditylum_brightwellii.AAC.1